MTEKRGLSLGIDLGGTSVKVGVVQYDGTILARGQHATEVEKGPSGVVTNMVLAAQEALQGAGLQLSDLDGVGVGTPGICDAPAGTVVSSGNLYWSDVPLSGLLGERLGVPVKLENDANCAALGEQWCGAARGRKDVALFTLGTGVGGGLILDGQIYRGARGWAGELGHMPLVLEGQPCTCGQQGCLETVASATAIGRAGEQAVTEGRSAAIGRIAAEQGGRVDARAVIYAAREGDSAALAILQEAGEHLGLAAAILVSALNPELILVGGGASKAGDLLLEPMRRIVTSRAMPGPAQFVQVAEATLGNDAGLIGAASLVWR